MSKIPRLAWLLPTLALAGVTTWAFAALNEPAPMADWPRPADEVSTVEVPPHPPPRVKPRRSLLARVRTPVPEVVEEPAIDVVAAMAPSADRPVVYADIGALWRAPIGRAFERCLERESERERFEITTLASTVERIATDGRVIAMEGELSPAAHHILFGDRTPTPYGDGARLYAGRGARVTDRLTVMGKGYRPDVRAAVDRAEGRAAPAVALPASERYGEVSALIPPRIVGRVLDELADVSPDDAAAIERATLHIDAADDVLVTLELFASDTHALAGVRDSLGLAAAALRAGRRFTSVSGPRVDDVQVEQRGGRLTVMLQMSPEEALRIVPECRN